MKTKKSYVMNSKNLFKHKFNIDIKIKKQNICIIEKETQYKIRQIDQKIYTFKMKIVSIILL